MAKDKVWTADQGQPPKEPDDASVGKSSKKDMPEQLGSAIRVEKEPAPKPPMEKKAKGGSVSARADGCCTKGKTRGKMV